MGEAVRHLMGHAAGRPVAFRGHVGDQGYAALWLRLCNVQDTICSVLSAKPRSLKSQRL